MTESNISIKPTVPEPSCMGVFSLHTTLDGKLFSNAFRRIHLPNLTPSFWFISKLTGNVSTTLIIKSGQKLKQNYDKLTNLIPVMSSTLSFSRITGALLAIGFLVSVI